MAGLINGEQALWLLLCMWSSWGAVGDGVLGREQGRRPDQKLKSLRELESPRNDSSPSALGANLPWVSGTFPEHVPGSLDRSSGILWGPALCTGNQGFAVELGVGSRVFL